MIYKYNGKEVEVLRFTGNDTAQLADGTWVPSSMLTSVTPELSQEALVKAAKSTRAAKRGENN